MEDYTVIAWLDKAGDLEATDEYERFDGVNWSPKFRTIPKASAVVWSMTVSESAKKSAEKHAATINADAVRVYQYRNEHDPLTVARATISKEAK